MSSPPQVEIVKAERLRLPRILNSGRVAALKMFRHRITDWVEPATTVYEEPVIVTIKKKRKRIVDKREVEWWDEFTKDHLHPDVMRFRDLLDHKKAVGYTITVVDGVLAYMTVFGYGERAIITGFLRAMGDVYPAFRDVEERTVGEALSRLARERVVERLK